MPSPPTLSQHRVLVVAAIACSGLIASVGLWHSAQQREKRDLLQEFRHRADLSAHSARDHVWLYPEIAAHLESIAEREDDAHIAMLEEVFEFVSRRHPSIAILEWVPLVPHADRAAFEQKLSQRVGDDVQIKSRQADGSFVVAPPADHYYPIWVPHPWDGNEAILAYDLRSAPTIAALEHARATGGLTATQQFSLAQSTNDHTPLAVILIIPVRGRTSGDFLGFVQCVVQPQRFFAQLHRDFSDPALLIHYEDASAGPEDPPILYANHGGWDQPGVTASTAPPIPPVDARRPDVYIASLPLGGRDWRFVARLNPAWAAEQHSGQPAVLFGGGLLVTFLISALVNASLLRARDVERLVEERTRDLEETRRMLERDIVRRQTAEANWRENEALLRGLLNNSSTAIFIKDLRGRYIMSNEQFRQAIRRSPEELHGATAHDLFPPETADVYVAEDRTIIEEKHNVQYEGNHDLFGERRHELVLKFPIFDQHRQLCAIGGIVTDISSRVEAENLRRDYERKLQSNQRLESLGVLAGGIAHDFNNLLTSILGQASLMRRSRTLAPPQDQQASRIEVAARRAAELCDQMLTYAGKADREEEVVDLNAIIRDTTDLLSSSLPKNHPISDQLDPDLPPISASATQIRQVIMNLVINASDALDAAPGQIMLQTGTQHFTAKQLARAIGQPELPEGDYVVLTVQDDGPGIERPHLDRIFEPFYTTKFQGRGLGLSTVLGVANHHHGALFVESRLGVGTTFQLAFTVAQSSRSDLTSASLPDSPEVPATPAPPSAVPEPSPAAAPPSPPDREPGILVVDDEPQVRELAAMVLESEGIKPFEAPDGAAALSLYQKHRAAIDLVLLDLTMPGMPGAEVLTALRRLNPELPIIVMSGYTPDDPRARVQDAAYNAFIQKPYEIDTLLDAIQPFLP